MLDRSTVPLSLLREIKFAGVDRSALAVVTVTSTRRSVEVPACWTVTIETASCVAWTGLTSHPEVFASEGFLETERKTVPKLC